MKYIITFLIFAVLAILATTNPEYLSAQSLILILLFVTLSIVYLSRIALRAIKPHGREERSGAILSQAFDIRSLSLGVVAIAFLFVLNLAGSLSGRDFVLAMVLSFLAHFYIEKRLSKSQPL